MALKWRHAGQACITANRVYVQKGVYNKFAEIIANKTREFKIGHGAEKGTTLGPVTTPRSLDKAEQQIADAKKHGGQVVLGGNKLHGQKGYEGYFFEPTLITGAKGEMLITREETFAPIMALYEFDTEDEAVQKANDTSMGLASCKWQTYAGCLPVHVLIGHLDFFTKNIDRTWRLLENLEAGMIGMNTGNSSAAESPFGGIKESGYGKESGKDVAVQEVSCGRPRGHRRYILLTRLAVHDHEDRHSHIGGPLLGGVYKIVVRPDSVHRRNAGSLRQAARAVSTTTPQTFSRLVVDTSAFPPY